MTYVFCKIIYIREWFIVITCFGYSFLNFNKKWIFLLIETCYENFNLDGCMIAGWLMIDCSFLDWNTNLVCVI